jgi:hypothetical protein
MWAMEYLAPEWGSVTDLCEHDIEQLVSIEGEFYTQLSNCKLFKSRITFGFV